MKITSIEVNRNAKVYIQASNPSHGHGCCDCGKVHEIFFQVVKGRYSMSALLCERDANFWIPGVLAP